MVAGGSGLASSEYYGFATVKTDADDYAPGTIVNITGSGWQPGETVSLLLHEDVDPPFHADRTLTAVADAFGNIANSDFAPESHDIGVRFYLTATGASSQARTTFTDAVSFNTLTVGAQTPSPISPGSSSTYGLTLGFSGSGTTGCSATLSIVTGAGQTGLPAGTGTSFSTTPVPSTGGNGSSTLTITTNAITTLPGTYTFTVRGVAPGVSGGQGCNAATINTPATLLVAGPATHFSVTGFPSPVTAGTAGSFTVTALDTNNNTAIGYTGTATFSSSDAQVIFAPGSYTFLAGDKGVRTFTNGATLKTAGTQSITATDGGITGTQSGIVVNAAATAQLAFTTQPVGDTAGNPLTTQPVVKVQDAFGNTRTTSTGSGASITLAIVPGTGTAGAVLSCTTNPLGASAGVASFANCSINLAGTGYRLRASTIIVGSPFTVDSASFDIASADAIAPTTTITLGPASPNGDNGWYISNVHVTVAATDNAGGSGVAETRCVLDPVLPPATFDDIPAGCAYGAGADVTTDGMHVVYAASKDTAGNEETPVSTAFKLDKTGPTASLSASGTLGNNGWYTSDVTVSTSGTDSVSNPTTCTTDQSQTTDTTGQEFHGSCTNDAGLKTDAEPLTIKRDATPPVLTLAFTPDSPDGNNGWWKTPGGVPFLWSCSDATSGIDATYNGGCPSPLSGTETAQGTTNFTDQVKDEAGNLSVLVNRDLKLDNVAPTVVRNLAADSCSLPGNAGWCRGTQTAGFTASDPTSGVASPCSGASCNFTQSTGTNGSAVNIPSGAVSDAAGNSNPGIDAGPFMIDSVAPALSPTVSPNPVVLNGSATGSPNATDTVSGVASSSCAAVVTSSVGPHTVSCTATDVAGNTQTADASYSVIYAPFGTLNCFSGTGHQILQPINLDGTSVFKQGSTVPAKFRVCDANGNSIGTAGVVSSFKLTGIISGLITDVMDAAVDSTTPDIAFRWSATDQQWIYNISTKNSPFVKNKTYIFLITLNDGSTIPFQFGTK